MRSVPCRGRAVSIPLSFQLPVDSASPGSLLIVVVFGRTCSRICLSNFPTDKISESRLIVWLALGNGGIMSTYMALTSSVNDSFCLAQARHTIISPALHPQDNFVSRTAWRFPPDFCPLATTRPCLSSRESHSSPRKSEPQRRQTPQDSLYIDSDRVYPSPPLTGSSLGTTVPLPLIRGQASMYRPLRTDCGDFTPSDMSHEATSTREPLSPPPTYLLSTLDLPHTDPPSSPARTDNLPDRQSCMHGEDEEARDITDVWRPHSIDATDETNDSLRCVGEPSLPTPVSPTSSWSFDGTLSDLDTVEEPSTVAPQCLPSRIDSGFVEYLPHEKYSGEKLPNLPEDSVPLYAKIEPSSFWAPQSPVSIDGPLLLDHRSPLDSGYSNADFRQSSLFAASPATSSHADTTPSDWSSMDWSSSEEQDCDSPPVSPRPRSLSLDLPDLDLFASSNHLGPDPSLDSQTGLPTLFGRQIPEVQRDAPCHDQHEQYHEHLHYRDGNFDHSDMMNIDEPPSPRSVGIHLPPSAPGSDDSFADTAIPPDEDSWPPSPAPLSPSRHLAILPDLGNHLHNDFCLTPVPRSPHSPLTSLPELDPEDSLDVPPSPTSPHLTLPSSPGEFNSPTADVYTSSGTISPSLLSTSNDSEGLGLFLQPISVDPPLARSPSPDDDDLQFLDVQLDPASSNLEVDEFLKLRAMRRQALATERDARSSEAELAERVSEAANALLPPQQQIHSAHSEVDADERRTRKRELHTAMDMRAEVRRMRKREKQRSKEIGALLDLKMGRGVAPGKGSMRSIAHLVANMLLRRRDTFRPLANRKASGQSKPYIKSHLFHAISLDEDMLGVGDE
ncbi:hypothetical protein AcV5_005544 [Taiwanofungus camphoratus]|nr:hypothetical protein AcV5_005544 [Antrodia cinnamomea]